MVHFHKKRIIFFSMKFTFWNFCSFQLVYWNGINGQENVRSQDKKVLDANSHGKNVKKIIIDPMYLHIRCTIFLHFICSFKWSTIKLKLKEYLMTFFWIPNMWYITKILTRQVNTLTYWWNHLIRHRQTLTLPFAVKVLFRNNYTAWREG